MISPLGFGLSRARGYALPTAPLTNCLAPIRFFCGGRSGKERSAFFCGGKERDFFCDKKKKYIKNKRLESHRRTKKDRQVGI